MAEKCKECGCKCVQCAHDDEHQDMHLHAEIENLRQRLMERDSHIVTMETQFLNEADKFPNGELASTKEELLIWQEKYSRLCEAHKRVQKVNQNLEDKLLRIVDKCETEKSAFTKDIATLSHRLADANYTIHRLTQDNEKYRNDVNLAIQLLQCKPSNFVGQKYDSLPAEVQAKVRTYVAQKRRPSDANPPDVKSITVPISTFPPTAMVYNVSKPATEKQSDDDNDESKPPVDIVSAAIMAKVLEDREKERIFAKHCDTCSCHRSILMVDAETQTNAQAIFSCNECTTRYTQSLEKHSDNHKIVEKNSQSKEHHQNSIMHGAYHQANENTVSNGKVQYHHNSHCTKNLNCQHSYTRDKHVVRNGRLLESTKEDNRGNINLKSNLNKKNSLRRSDMQLQKVFPNNQNDNISKQAVSQNANDTLVNSKVAGVDKVKQGKVNKRCDLQTDTKSTANYWNKLEKKSSTCSHAVPENSKGYFSGRQQSQIDIINDRLWKNEWTKLKSQVNFKGSNNADKVNSDVEFDVINDRVWRSDRSVREICEIRENRQIRPAQLTVIEVKNIERNQNEAAHVDVATSPSFSSDSMVISTSDPSSSSSDVIQSGAASQLVHNTNHSKPSQNRISGARNCLVRVTPGSKNILLDNAGHYKTVLYTSGNNKGNSGLVQRKKPSQFGSEGSLSSSSEENSPVLLHDNNQLQRVAEWVQSSVRMEGSVPSGYTKLKSTEDIMDTLNLRSSSLIYISGTSQGNNTLEYNATLLDNTEETRHEESVINIADFGDETVSSELNDLCLSVNAASDEPGKDKDLITFDVPNEDEKSPKKLENSDLVYEVNVTKEMEETYLKLAASLDPVALSLSNTEGADLTIEKYRKDHKKLHTQRTHEKLGSKV